METIVPRDRPARRALRGTPFAVELHWSGWAVLIIHTPRRTTNVHLGYVWAPDHLTPVKPPVRALLDVMAEEWRADKADARRNAREDPKTWS